MSAGGVRPSPPPPHLSRPPLSDRRASPGLAPLGRPGLRRAGRGLARPRARPRAGLTGPLPQPPPPPPPSAPAPPPWPRPRARRGRRRDVGRARAPSRAELCSRSEGDPRAPAEAVAARRVPHGEEGGRGVGRGLGTEMSVGPAGIRSPNAFRPVHLPESPGCALRNRGPRMTRGLPCFSVALSVTAEASPNDQS